MAQVTIYLDDELLARTRAAADAAGLSVSGWLARLARDRTATAWPDDVAALSGAWRDLPLAEALRATVAQDTPREAL